MFSLNHTADAVEPRPAVGEVVFRVRGLRKAFGGLTVLDGLDLDLHRGEVVLLRGDNGSGKTTLLNILTGNLEPDSGVIDLLANGTSRRFAFPLRWWEVLNPLSHFTPESVAQEGVGRSWQEIRLFRTQDLSSNVAVAMPRQLGENPLWATFRRGAVRRQETANVESVRNRLADIGMAERADSLADHVSLGQAKRVAIARAVHGGARVLLLDEPLAGLDSAGIKQVLELLERLGRRDDITLVIVEHVFHIPRLLNQATTVWTLDAGRVTVQPAAEVRAEWNASRSDGFAGCLDGFAIPSARITHRPLSGGAVLTTVTPPGADKTRFLLEVDGLIVQRGNRIVLGAEGGLSFALREGEVGVLRAPNGWGKTTLLEAIAGLIPVAGGRVRLRGAAVDALAPWHRNETGLSFLQARDHTFPNLTVSESLRIAGIRDDPEVIRELRGRRVSDLSGGQRQQVALASVLSPEKGRIYCLDEPFGALDQAASKRLQGQLADVLPGSTCLIAEPSFLQN